MAGHLNGETASHTSSARRGWDAHSAVSIGFALPDGVISIPNEPGSLWRRRARLEFSLELHKQGLVAFQWSGNSTLREEGRERRGKREKRPTSLLPCRGVGGSETPELLVEAGNRETTRATALKVQSLVTYIWTG